jgi:hypothetical protein
MAKHHPDLIFCRKQPGVGASPVKMALFLIFDLFSFERSGLPGGSGVSLPKKSEFVVGGRTQTATFRANVS